MERTSVVRVVRRSSQLTAVDTCEQRCLPSENGQRDLFRNLPQPLVRLPAWPATGDDERCQRPVVKSFRAGAVKLPADFAGDSTGRGRPQSGRASGTSAAKPFQFFLGSPTLKNSGTHVPATSGRLGCVLYAKSPRRHPDASQKTRFHIRCAALSCIGHWCNTLTSAS